MSTTKQFQDHVSNHFPGFTVQTRIIHGKLPHGWVDIYDAQSRLVLEIGTRLIGHALKEFSLSCAELSDMIKGQQSRADYQR